MQFSKKLRVLSFFLLLIMVFTFGVEMLAVPVLAYANTETKEEMSEEEKQKQEAEEAWNKYALEKKNKDGTSTAQIFLSPIRYKDENGRWKDIDNTIEENYGDEKKEGLNYTNKAAEVNVDIADKVDNDTLARVKKDKYAISFKALLPQNNNKRSLPSKLQPKVKFVETEESYIDRNSKKVTQEEAEEADRDDSKIDITREYKSIKFENVQGNPFDLVITPTSDGIKEDIILDKLPEETSYSYEFDFENLKVELQEDNAVVLKDKDTKEIVGYVDVPYMYDSNPANMENYDIKVELEKQENGKYKYTITPDRKWLEAKERVYPVTIDPTVTFKGDATGDNMVAKSNPGTTYAGNKWMCVGKSTVYDMARGYVSMRELFSSTALKGTYITKATLYMYQDYDGTSKPSIGLYPATGQRPDTSRDISWNNQHKLGSVAATQTVSTMKGYTWDLTSAVRTMHQKGSGFQSFYIKLADEKVDAFKKFRSKEYGSNAPYFTLTYAQAPSAPSTVTVNPSATWTKDSQVTVNWSGVSVGSGATSIKRLEYSTTSATAGFATIPSATTASGSAKITVPEGKKTVWVRAVNNYNLIGAAKASSTQYWKDATAPSEPENVTVSPEDWTNEPVTVTRGDATDSDSGIIKYQYAVSQSSSTTPANSEFKDMAGKAISVTPTEQGYQYVWVRAMDNAGNVGIPKVSNMFRYDGIAPKVPSSLDISKDENKITISWSGFTDGGSGIDKLQFMIDNIGDRDAEDSDYVDIPDSNGYSGSYTFTCQEGEEKIVVRAVDKAGNTSDNWGRVANKVSHLKTYAYLNKYTYLNWKPIYSDEVRYNVYRVKAGEENSQIIARNIKQSYWYDIENLVEGETYGYTVKVVINGIEQEEYESTEIYIQSADISGYGAKDNTEYPEFDIAQGTGKINPLSKNIFYSVSDLSTNSTVMPIEFIRHYNSKFSSFNDGDYSTQPMGMYWSHSLDKRIMYAQDGDYHDTMKREIIRFKDGDMTTYDFRKESDGTYSAPAGFKGSIKYNVESKKFTIKFYDGSQYIFNICGLIEKELDNNGNSITYHYDNAGKLLEVKNCVDDFVRFEYNNDQMISKVTVNAQVYEYAYTNRKLSTVYLVTADGKQVQYRYGYDIVSGGELTTITNAIGDVFKFTHNRNSSKFLSVTYPVSESQSSTLVIEKDSAMGKHYISMMQDGKEINYAYRYTGLLEEKIESGKSTSFYYDDKNSNGDESKYNVTLNLIKQVNPDDTEKIFTYDKRGNVLTETDEMGHVTTYTYEQTHNEPVTVSTPFNESDKAVTYNSYDSHGNLLNSYSNGSELKTFNYYGTFGNITKSITLTGPGATAKSNQDAEVLINSKSYHVKVEEYTFDSKGRCIKSVKKNSAGAEDEVEETSYNENNQVITESNPTDTTQYTYNDDDMVTKITGQSGSETSEEKTEYDEVGNVKKLETDDDILMSEHDGLGRDTESSSYTTDDPDTPITTDESEYFTRSDGTSYTVVTTRDGISEKVLKQVVTETDQWGNVTLQGTVLVNESEHNTFSSLKTFEGFKLISFTQTTYDKINKPICQIDESGLKVETKYNKIGEVVSKKTSKGSTVIADEKTFYDDAGNVVRTEDMNGNQTVRVYDKAGRVLIEKTKKGSKELITNTYKYDLVVNGFIKIEVKDGLGRKTEQKYDALENMIEEKKGSQTTT